MADAPDVRRSTSLPWRARPSTNLATAIPGVGLLCTASFLAVADTTLVAIALPALRADLAMDVASSAWVLIGYSVTFGGLLLLCGRLGDLVGRLRMFRWGLVVFGVASLVAAVAWNPAVLVAMRLAQGIGAAAFVPASLALLNASATDDQVRSRAVGLYGAAASVGFVVGMLGGGVLTELAGWRSVFLVVLPVVGVVLLRSRRLAEPTRSRATPRLDVTGAVAVTLGVGLLTYALSAAPQQGWGSSAVLGTGISGLACLVLFPVFENRASAPLVPLNLAADRRLLPAHAAIALQSLVGISWLFLLSAYFQDLHELSPMASGLLFTPMTIAGLLSALLAGRLVHRYGAPRTSVLGMAIVAAGTAVMAVATGAAGILPMVAGSVVAEAGFLLSNVALTVAGTGHPDSDLEGLLAGILNTAIQLGTALGLGLVASVTAGLLSHGLADALRAGFLTCVAAALLGVLLTTRIKPRQAPRSASFTGPHHLGEGPR
jgi:MFS family permease